MKESYNDEQMDFIQYNQPFQKSKLDNINNQESYKTSEFTVLLHFSSTKSFSFKIPNTWTTKKLISFILSTFKSEFKNSIPTFIHKGNMLQPFSESLLKNYFDPLKLNHLIVTLKDKEKITNDESPSKNNKNILDTIFSKSNKEVFKTQEFCDMEKEIIEDYNNIFKEDSFNNFPLMSPAYNKRREQIKYDPQTEKFAQFEPVPLEDFPFRNYFQLKIIFKCIISFFALGIYIKGFNFILFLCVLVIYYWYCINNIIEDFYKKKFQEIGLNEDEYKRIGEEIKDIGRKFGSFGKDDKGEYEEGEEESESDDENANENDNGNKDENNNEDIIYEEKSDENISNNNINKEASKITNLDFEEEMKDINFKDEKNNNIKEPLKDLEFKEEEKKDEIKTDNPQILNNNIINENKDNININNNRIKNINKKNKKKEQKREEPEKETPLQIAYQIIYLFFISFIPPWCDEFEAQNPMPPNNPRRTNANNVNDNNGENQNNNINNDINNINNENNINNNLFNNINNEINDNNIGQQSSNSPQQDEDSNNNKMTSSKVVNISEDSNKDNKIYNLLKKDNPNLNENEYVFSEHGGIDSLSMNSELFKQKKEKEKEKENKENVEKENEKQIFEEEKENIIEEEKHLKNE